MIPSPPILRRLCWLLFALGFPTGSLHAQTTDLIQARIQFNFSNPGARSLGMGGAFTARADDATAVYANPAGLTQLFQPEVFVDTRGWRFSNRVIDGGRQLRQGEVEGIGLSETDDRLQGLSFLSAFYPSSSGRWVGGFFHHQTADYRTEVHSEATELEPPALGFVRPVDGVYRLRMETAGGALGVRLSPSFSLGLSLGWTRFELASRLERWNKRRNEATVLAPSPVDASGLDSPFGNAPDNIILYYTQEQPGDHGLSATLGVLWQSRRQIEGVPVVALGAVYRRGPEFDFQAGLFGRAQSDGRFISLLSPSNPPEGCSVGRGCRGTFDVPEVAGIGLSIKPRLPWLLALDVNHVEYSDLLNETIDVLGVEAPAGTQIRPTQFRLDDGYEVRAGVEYALYRERRLPDIFLRAGAWYDPDHKMRYLGQNAVLQATFFPGSDEFHYSAGVGLRYRRFQLDAAVDLSPRVDTLSLAATYYFGRR